MERPIAIPLPGQVNAIQAQHIGAVQDEIGNGTFPPVSRRPWPQIRAGPGRQEARQFPRQPVGKGRDRIDIAVINLGRYLNATPGRVIHRQLDKGADPPGQEGLHLPDHLAVHHRRGGVGPALRLRARHQIKPHLPRRHLHTVRRAAHRHLPERGELGQHQARPIQIADGPFLMA